MLFTSVPNLALRVRYGCSLEFLEILAGGMYAASSMYHVA
jgi:hypothetical protein